MSDVCNYPLGDGRYCANDDVGDGRIYCVMHRRRVPLAKKLDEEPVMTTIGKIGWPEIAQQNRELLTRALEKLAAVEQERDRALEQRDAAEAGAAALKLAIDGAIVYLKAIADDHSQAIELLRDALASDSGAALLARLAAAERERDQATAALVQFGKHTAGCMAWRGVFWEPPLECDCGLAAALAAPATTEER